MFFRRIKIKEINAGIYVIEIEGCEKFYIGSSKNLKKRNYEHFNLLKRNKHFNRHLQFAFNKYGEKSFKFSVLVICENNKDFLILLEQKIIDSYNFDKLFNTSKIAGCPENHKIANRKLSNDNINDIFDLYINGKSSLYISKKFNIHRSIVHGVLNREMYIDVFISEDKILLSKNVKLLNKSRRFTEDEIQIIKDNHLKMTRGELSKIIKCNPNAISRVVKRLKLIDCSIIEKIDRFLIDNYEKINIFECAEYFNVSIKFLKSRAKKLNIKIRNSNRFSWTDEKIKFIKLNYHKGDLFLANYFNVSKSSITNICHLNKIKFKKNYWSQKDINYLIKNFGVYKVKDLAIHLNKTEKSIRSKYWKLNRDGRTT